MVSGLKVSLVAAGVGIGTNGPPGHEQWWVSVLTRLYFEIPPGSTAFVPEHQTRVEILEPVPRGPRPLEIRSNRWAPDGQGAIHNPGDGIYIRSSGTMLTGCVFHYPVSEFPSLDETVAWRVAMTLGVANSSEPISFELRSAGVRGTRDYGNDAHDANADWIWDLKSE